MITAFSSFPLTTRLTAIRIEITPMPGSDVKPKKSIIKVDDGYETQSIWFAEKTVERLVEKYGNTAAITYCCVLEAAITFDELRTLTPR